MSTVINLYKILCEYRDTKHSTISPRIISEKMTFQKHFLALDLRRSLQTQVTQANSFEKFDVGTYTLRIQHEYTQTQCVSVAKEVNNKKVPGTVPSLILPVIFSYRYDSN